MRTTRYPAPFSLLSARTKRAGHSKFDRWRKSVPDQGAGGSNPLTMSIYFNSLRPQYCRKHPAVLQTMCDNIRSSGWVCPIRPGWILSCFVHRFMRMRNTTRRITVLTVMGVLVLACAVFGWGLHYKMSLYGAPGTRSASVPHAKLLSQEERPASQRDEALSRPASVQPQPLIFYPIFFVIALGMSLRLTEAMRIWSRDPQAALRRQLRAHSDFFSFRPPPVSIPSY